MRPRLELALFTMLLWTSPVAAQTAPEPAGEVLNAETDPSQRMTVPVMVNGLGPFQFIIDSGSDSTVISEELADRLALPTGTKARLHAMSGQRDVRMVTIKSLQVSTNVLHDVRAAALAARNIGADGILGIDSLKNQRVVMDFKAQTMQIMPSRRKGPVLAEDAGMIVVTARTRLGQLVMVDADANGQKIWVVLDTGAQNSVGNLRLRQLLLKQSESFATKQVTMTDVLGNTTVAVYAQVQHIRFGDIDMSNAAITFADAHPFKLFDLANRPSMMLGMEGLRSFDRIAIDFANRTIKFLLPKPL